MIAVTFNDQPESIASIEEFRIALDRDEYQLAWCIKVEQCYRILAYFYVNEGAQPDWVSWHAS